MNNKLISTLEDYLSNINSTTISSIENIDAVLGDLGSEDLQDCLLIYYLLSQITSLLAAREVLDSTKKSLVLNKSLSYLKKWLELGFYEDGWIKLGKIPRIEVYQMGKNPNLSYLFVYKKQELEEIFPEKLHVALPWKPYKKNLIDRQNGFSGGGGGCFPSGTLVHTPNGPVVIENIKEGDKVISVELKEPFRYFVTNVIRLHKYYQQKCLVIDEKHILSITQPLYEQELGWVYAGELEPGMKILNANLTFQIIRRISIMANKFDVLSFEIDHNSHNFLATDLVCHNPDKMNI